MKRKIKQIKKQFSEKMARKKIKDKKFKKKDLRGKSLEIAISIIRSQDNVEDWKKESKEEKIKLINEIEERIQKIIKLNVFEYLRYINGETYEENEKIQFQQKMMLKKK